MKRTAAALTLGLTLAVAPAPAQAQSTPRCVTAAEYITVRQGMTPTQVRLIFGPKGTQRWSLPGTRAQVRSYRPCPRYDQRQSWVVITYGANGRLLKAEARLIKVKR